MALLSADFSTPAPVTKTDDLKQQQVGAHHADLRLVCARTPDRRRDRHDTTMKKRLNIWPPASLMADAHDYCTKHQITLTAFFIRAAEELLAREDPDTHGVRAHTERIDLDLDLGFRTQSSIRDMYKFWTETFHSLKVAEQNPKPSNWTIRNDDAASKHTGQPLEIIELGIIHTLSKYNAEAGRIKSFAYYSPEINLLHSQLSHLTRPKLIMQHQIARQRFADWLGVVPPDFTSEDYGKSK